MFSHKRLRRTMVGACGIDASWFFNQRELLETRSAIAQEIERLQTEPLLVVQTSPPEGTVVPVGPRAVNLRGWSPPGAKVSVDGKVIDHVRPTGFLRDSLTTPELNLIVWQGGVYREIKASPPNHRFGVEFGDHRPQ